MSHEYSFAGGRFKLRMTFSSTSPPRPSGLKLIAGDAEIHLAIDRRFQRQLVRYDPETASPIIAEENAEDVYEIIFGSNEQFMLDEASGTIYFGRGAQFGYNVIVRNVPDTVFAALRAVAQGRRVEGADPIPPRRVLNRHESYTGNVGGTEGNSLTGNNNLPYLGNTGSTRGGSRRRTIRRRR